MRLKEHKQSLSRGDITTSKLVEHAITEAHIFEWDNANVIASEKRWKARKFHEADLIYMVGDQVISAPSMDIDPVWRPILDEYKQTKKINFENILSTGLRRSVRLQAKQQAVGSAEGSRQAHRRRIGLRLRVRVASPHRTTYITPLKAGVQPLA
jgi:hypothetical protein